MSAVIDASDFLTHLRRAEKQIAEAAASTVRRAAVVAWESANSTSLYRDRTGKLREKTQVVEGRTEFSATLVADTKYASFVESGTVAHKIVPKSGKFLSFVAGGTRVFSRSVNHPGTRPRPFMTNASKAGEQFLLATLERAANAAVAG